MGDLFGPGEEGVVGAEREVESGEPAGLGCQRREGGGRLQLQLGCGDGGSRLVGGRDHRAVDGSCELLEPAEEVLIRGGIRRNGLLRLEAAEPVAADGDTRAEANVDDGVDVGEIGLVRPVDGAAHLGDGGVDVPGHRLGLGEVGRGPGRSGPDRAGGGDCDESDEEEAADHGSGAYPPSIGSLPVRSPVWPPDRPSSRGRTA